MREYRQYTGGQWTGAEKLYDDFDPYRGTVVARVPAGTREDAKRAVDAAAAAFPAWADLPPAAKQALFLRAATSWTGAARTSSACSRPSPVARPGIADGRRLVW